MASAANISAFTLGSAIGIYLGGAAIDGGIGVTSVNWIGGLMTTSGLLLGAGVALAGPTGGSGGAIGARGAPLRRNNIGGTEACARRSELSPEEPFQQGRALPRPAHRLTALLRLGKNKADEHFDRSK